MKTVEILVVATHTDILNIILRLINQRPGWNATGATDIGEAIAACTSRQFKVALIGAGLNEEEERNLHRKLKLLDPSLEIVYHYGGGSGLLFAEIEGALSR